MEKKYSNQTKVMCKGIEAKKIMYVWKDANNLICLGHRIHVSIGKPSPDRKDSVLIKGL